MRLTFHLFGFEVCAIALDRDQPECGPPEHDNTAAQVETAYDQRIGFHSQTIPSLES